MTATAASSTDLPRRPLRAVVALSCVLTLLAVGLSAPAAAAQEVADDPAVRAARARLAERRTDVDAVTRALDQAAGAFEQANAHATRLADEVEQDRRDTATAARRAAEAEEAFARSVAQSYRRPGADLALAGAVALTPDAGLALHRSALLERMAAGERLRVQRAQLLAARTAEDSRKRTVVHVGVASAAAEARRQAEDLELALVDARGAVDDAERAVTAAEDAARVRIEQEQRRVEEERRRTEAAQRASRVAVVGSDPPPPVAGKVCPIGAPNAFIDSWGFPRSGGRSHQGVDMFADHGMPLYAVADGTITSVGNNRLGGLSINLVDEAGDRYYYAHLSAASVAAGQRVRAGEVIGANGNSGNARTTPPHLHWQYHPGNGPPVNPYALASALCR